MKKKSLIAVFFILATAVSFVVHAEEANLSTDQTASNTDNGQVGTCRGIWPFC